MKNGDHFLHENGVIHSNVPLYRCSGLICFEVCCTCSNNFTLSRGATAVFAIAADRPPARKSIRKDLYASISQEDSKSTDLLKNVNSPSRRLHHRLKLRNICILLIVVYIYVYIKISHIFALSVKATKRNVRFVYYATSHLFCRSTRCTA